MKKIRIVILLIIVASFLAAFYLYPYMPERIASHWNIQGEVDGYMSKFWGLFLMPIMSLAMFLLFLLIPKLDPLKENIKKFRDYFDIFILLIIVFVLYIYILTILWSFGWRFNMGQFMAPAMGVLFFYAGELIGKSKRNWSIGIRTPWTLSSEAVWDKTHKLGAKLFKISGVIALLGFVFPDLAFYFVLVPVIFSVIYSFLYSYLEYQKEKK
jgi:uncharacterized membrane protein